MVVLIKLPLILAALVADAPPVKPVPVGNNQLYVVPVGTVPFIPFTGAIVKLVPLQVVSDIGLMTPTGFTVTVTVNGVPVQLPEVGVTVYVAICAALVGFTNVWLIELTPVAVTPPVIPPVTDGVDQLYVVPAGTVPFVPFTGVTLNTIPVVTIVLISVIAATGLTFTVTVNDVPAQLPDTGLT